MRLFSLNTLAEGLCTDRKNGRFYLNSELLPNALSYLTEFLALPNYREVMGYIDNEKEA
jgi:hypothetical protein